MPTRFCALLFRSALVSDTALSQGFALALAGKKPRPASLLLAQIPEAPDWTVAFFQKGTKDPEKDFAQGKALFGAETPPALYVRELAADPTVVVYSLTYSDQPLHDEACRFSDKGVARSFVREGSIGLELGKEQGEEADAHVLERPARQALDELQSSLYPYRGTTLLKEQLGFAPLSPLVRAWYQADRNVRVQWVDPHPDSLAEQVRALNRTLHRIEGRGLEPLPSQVAGAAIPQTLVRFAQTYDWADPADPEDLYKDIALGDLEGTLRFLRPRDWLALENNGTWKPFAAKGYFPLAQLFVSATERQSRGLLALLSDGESLRLTGSLGIEREAGPRFGELLLYLALGWQQRTPVQEELIQALMLQARQRTEG